MHRSNTSVRFCGVVITYLMVGQFAMNVQAAEKPERVNNKLPANYVSEAPLPDGFPPPSKVGEVVEKHYPASRGYSASGENAFFSCFAFLQENNLEMTAPVQTDYRSLGKDLQGAEPEEEMELPVEVERMHFFLEKASLIEPKQDGQVTVSDVPALHVLGIAHQGKLAPDDVARLEKRLKEALDAKAELKSVGPVRLLGYNGPQVPEEKRYWELQVPVKSKSAAAAPNESP